MTIKIVIADDHTMMREGLSQALDSIPDIEVIATAADGRQLLEILERVTPDVALVDIEMPKLSGIGALRRLEGKPLAIVVTMHTDDDQRRKAAAAGARGFLSKSAPLPDLAAAIRAVAAGEIIIEEESTPEILDQHRQPILDEGAAALTARERELLKLLASGVSSTEDLADQLYISQKTVKNHLASIYQKLDARDRTQAVLQAVRMGIVTLK